MHCLPKVVSSVCLTCIFAMGSATTTQAQFTIDFGVDDFTQMPVFNSLLTFDFSIGINEPLVAGRDYTNPSLSIVDYDVFGDLVDPTPSMFRQFNLQRTIDGEEFYTQGSSLNFAIRSSADLTDGLQVSELEDLGGGLVFEFDAREVGTARFHPARVQLFSNNTGRTDNSNNTGGVNTFTNTLVDVDFGEEYIVDLTFSPSLTLSTTTVPEPSSMTLLAMFGLAGLAHRRR